MSGETILVVDDHPLNLALLEHLLTLHGYRVRTAGDAVSTLASIEELRPDLILMDLQLPGMDGLELTRRLKQRPELDDVRIVAVTSYAMSGDEERALAAGCDGYMSKPIDTAALPGLVARHLRRATS